MRLGYLRECWALLPRSKSAQQGSLQRASPTRGRYCANLICMTYPTWLTAGV